MIVRYEGTATLMDCEALAVALRRPVSTIRARCTRAAVDAATGRQLYDADAATATLAQIPQRRAHLRRLTRSAI